MSDSAGLTDRLDDQSGAKVITTLKGSMGERITKALHKVEEKKKKRSERKAQVRNHVLMLWMYLLVIFLFIYNYVCFVITPLHEK